ncbi:NAD-dependent succinate-semialdehyde dehydrogenase [Ketobacter sp.]|uniref:NAD-dependent succinate-semialdehyde dehydrogenase n=1 Tax=Ketobacter sp. TaxID=2083498 RepID=UPI000F11555A|nr:NAD-dependent succinate-semialdehyde dehydrogenase [Ketobacter sp.]RLU00963.1 MAG: NAD-dependent succinate-semialdehyde dehydrogenase [Ketobacter sp.]
MLKPVNPATGVALPEVPSLDAASAAAVIDRVAAGFVHWKQRSFRQRADVVMNMAAAMRDAKQELAERMAMEMGKPLAEGLGEVEKSAFCAEYYAEQAEAFLAPESLPSDASNSYVQYPPLGTVLGILPWNAPVWLALRFLAPALMAGNTCVTKADPHVPATAQHLTALFHSAGLPADVMDNLPIETADVGAAIDHPRVKAVSFTGSSVAGQRVAAQAAAGLKPAVLELGGSDPCIVMADADLDKAADVVTLSRMINAGQSCIAAKRLLVEASVYDRFCDLLRQRFSAIVMGNPLDTRNQLGPLARADLRDALQRQVMDSIAAGARCILGGDPVAGPGYFYPPTLLLDVKPGMPVFEQETFGPVLAVTPFSTFGEALDLANATEYGLGASIWTRDDKIIQTAITSLQAGQVAVNGIVKTDPRLPSGGIGRSGYGRELGPHGIREFVNTQQIWIA